MTAELWTIGNVDLNNKDSYRTVDVFLENPEWDKHTRWFMLPMHMIRQLHVARFFVDVAVEDDYSARISTLNKIEKQYPSHVYVHSL